MEKLYRRADKYLMLEDNIRAATQTIMITNQSTEGNKSSEKKSFEFKEGQGRDRKQYCDQSQKMRKLPQFTPLNISYKKLLSIISDLPEFKWLAPIQTDHFQRNKSLRCSYHRDHGHEIGRCRSLKFLVEKLIKVRHLRKYVKEVDHIEESGQTTDRVMARAAILSESTLAISYILSGLSDNQY